jgi:hypothetical protein
MLPFKRETLYALGAFHSLLAVGSRQRATSPDGGAQLLELSVLKP